MDELGTVMKLLDQQKATVISMIKYYEDKVYGKGFLEAVLARLDEYRNQVSEMRENAHLAQKAVCISVHHCPVIYIALLTRPEVCRWKLC